MNQYLSSFLKGLAMGAANVIPGVSGGTIAFITGIYERLIHSLKSFDLGALKLLIAGDWRVFVSKTDLYFLLSILLGVAVSILSFARILKWSFANYEVYTLAFFFGLIIASILGVGRQISRLNFTNVCSILVGAAIAGGIAFLPPAGSNESFIYLMICGAVAISSMILPGLSGSYILLLMGNYLLVLDAISSFELGVIAPIAAGCILGLLLFAQLLSYLFKNFKDLTISLLTGFVAGSLAIIWPWKITNYMPLPNGTEKAIGYSWFLPEIEGSFFIAFAFIGIGFLMVWLMDNYSTTNKP
ncbi:MAG: DUF368 domain-containing protein [Cyclobacteriaceae bacterium]